MWYTVLPMFSVTSLLISMTHLTTLIVAVLVVIFLESILFFYKNEVTRSYKGKKQEILSGEEAERESLRYFSKLHIVSIVRMVYFFIISLVLIATYDIRAFSFFTVAFGAIILALREVIVSLLAYPHVVVSYDIGDDIRIAGVLGEIVRVRPLSTQLAGKDEKGDYNGKLDIVPNSKFFLEIIERHEIKNGANRRVSIDALYIQDEYKLPFNEWLTLLKSTLDAKLPKRSLKDVGNFKSYAGMRYKLQYDYDDDGYVKVSISFISGTKTANDKKEQIISFIESTKREKETTSR